MRKVFYLFFAGILVIGCKLNKSSTSKDTNDQGELSKVIEEKTEAISSANSSEHESVQWLSFEEAVEQSKTDKKKIFIDVYTNWCGWCKVMDKNTFNQPDIAKYLNENYYPVKLDAEQKEDIEFKGYTFKFVASGNKGYHQLAASLLNNKLSYPTVVFLDEDFNMIQPMPGYQKPDQFEKVIKYIGGDHYKTTAWADWEKTFESSIN